MSDVEAADPVTPEEEAEFACALRHVVETYRLPRFVANDVALRLLSFGQPPWHPVCTHTPRHLFAELVG